jgi:hypothetical protein
MRAIVATLALGSRPRQGVYKVASQEGSLGVMAHAPRSARECEGIDLHTPKGTSILGVGVLVDFWMFKDEYRGQNPMDWRVLYIIEKLLKRRCLKWACMTHLDNWNTSYGQKKGKESNWQFDSRPLKVRNQPDVLTFRWNATRRWKALNEGYNFALDLISIQGLHAKLWAPKVTGVPTLAISGFPFGSLETKCHLDVGLVERHKVYYKKEGGGFPQVRAMVSLVSPSCLWLVLAPKVLQLCTNHLVLVLCMFMWVVEACQFFLVPSRSSNTPLQSVASQGACPNSLFFCCFQFEPLKELGMRQPPIMN